MKATAEIQPANQGRALPIPFGRIEPPQYFYPSLLASGSRCRLSIWATCNWAASPLQLHSPKSLLGALAHSVLERVSREMSPWSINRYSELFLETLDRISSNLASNPQLNHMSRFHELVEPSEWSRIGAWIRRKAHERWGTSSSIGPVRTDAKRPGAQTISVVFPCFRGRLRL